MNSARRFATALHRCRHPLRLGGQQWRRRERRRQRLRRPRRRRKLAKRRSSRRRYRSSASLRVEGRVTRAGGRRGRFQDARDAPAQVDNRGRRRDGGSSASFASHAVVERKDRSARIFPGGPLRDAAGGFKSPVLADALGVFGTSSQECLLGAVILFAAPLFRERVRENA
jgi:hypothetical protein